MNRVLGLGRCVAAFASLLGAPRAQAQCDRTPRIVWSYPSAGERDVSPQTPLLLHTTDDVLFVHVTTRALEHSRAMASLPSIDGNVVFPAEEIAPHLQGGGPVAIELETMSGETLTLEFSVREEPAPAPRTARLAPTLARHFVGAGLERLSPRCRAIATAPSPSGCEGAHRNRMIGFDARIEDLETSRPADIHVRAWLLVGADDDLSAIPPQLWPADCGPPTLLLSEDLDDPDVCVSVAALVEGFPSRIVFPEHCLSGGEPWPAAQESAPADGGGCAIAPRAHARRHALPVLALLACAWLARRRRAR